MPLKLPRFERTIPLVAEDKTSTATFHQWWQEVVKNLETAFNALETAVIDIQAAQAAATAAQSSADAAQSSATATAREAARISSYPNPSAVLSAADVGTDCTVTVAAHTRVYPVQGSIDVPDTAIAGGTVTGLAFSTLYYIYYDDTTLVNGSPTFQATTSAATASAGAAAGRHSVGSVTTPADGGGGTSGGGYQTPGGFQP